MKFYLQWDGTYKTRAYNSRWMAKDKTFARINDAMAELKKQPSPHRIVVRMDDGSTRTFVLFEGTASIGCFGARKRRGLVDLGNGFFMPKIHSRKTNIKRKKKNTSSCEKSSILTELKAYAKSTP